MPASTSQREALLRTIEQKAHLDHRFERIERIDSEGGGGVFSLILRAWDRHSKEYVALKFFDPAKRSDTYRWECFKREVDILPRFDGKRDILQCRCHLSEFTENFANPLGIVYPVPFAYYAVELAHYDVSAALADDRWTATQKLEYFRAMCRAVQRIHRHNVAHRDLKPTNFLIMPNGALRLSDFGAARMLDPSAGHSSLLATYSEPPGDLRYASPEMMAALHDVDPTFALRGDIFALGAILFELFTGTVLNLYVLDLPMLLDLNRTMTAVPAQQRIRIFDSFVNRMASAHPLPNVGLFGNNTPLSILDLLNRLINSLAALDYRSRESDFVHIFMQIDRCLYILKHEAAYQKWREQKRNRRQH